MRQPDFPIDPQFTARWSPRALDGTAVTHEQMMTLFEAARWAPSSFNVQPWRYLYALRGTTEFEPFLGLLIPFNRSWAHSAGAIVFALSDTLMQAGPAMESKPSHSHSFDAGAGWAMMALQASLIGLHTHGMTGVDFDAARAALRVPERFRIEAAIAIGRIGDPAILPEHLRAREVPSDRKPVASFAFAGGFPGA